MSLPDAAAFLAQQWPGSFADACAAGSKFFFTGSPCRNGHVALRTTSHRRCLECGKEQSRRYYGKSGEKKRAYHAARYADDPERGRAYTKEWRKANPEKARQQWRLRKARRRGAEGAYTLAELQALAERQRHRCAECKTSIKRKFHVDHIMPLVRGGSNRISNIQLLCAPCNQRKQARHPLDWARLQGRLV